MHLFTYLLTYMQVSNVRFFVCVIVGDNYRDVMRTYRRLVSS